MINKKNQKKKTITKEISKFFNHYIIIDNVKLANEILKYLPSDIEKKQMKEFSIMDVRMKKYLVGLLEGDPAKVMYSELVAPIIKRTQRSESIEDVKKDLLGFHYIIPKIYEGKIESFFNKIYKRLPEWQYSVLVVNFEQNRELTLCFWSDKILSEDDLTSFIQENANWSLADEISSIY